MGLCCLSLHTFPSEAQASLEPTPPPRAWATPLHLDGLPNLHKVSAQLYRSAQPSAQGFKQLKQFDIGTVLNLRAYHVDQPPAGLEAMQWQHIYMVAGNFDEKPIIQALNIIAQSPKPVLVHCLHGADRTGIIVAMYRIVCQGWDKPQALAELMEGGYGYHRFFTNIPEFIESVDVPALRAQIHGVGCPAT